MQSEDNKRIAKNTLFLYLRMGFTILFNLYIVRIVWQVLGIEDYGIYNLVGGIVLMFQFLNMAMVASSQRYISYEIGTGRVERLRKVFSISVTVHYIIAVLILALAETIGVWFLNSKLNIPLDRINAANWVFQASVLAFILSVISVPYNACIVAHEHMKAYGYLGVMEVVLKLAAVSILYYIQADKLITYAFILLFVQIIIRFMYIYYCRKNFIECRYRFVKDSSLMREMFAFAGWSFLGNLGLSVREQGLNIILNIFYNVTLNAARGVALQVSNVISGFAWNFQMALNPQITKRYAMGEIDSMIDLVYRGCKFSLFLLLIITIPLWIACEQILKLWLDNITSATVIFLRLCLIMAVIDSMVGPITTALQATGHIKSFQILICSIMTLTLPASLVYMEISPSPYNVMYVSILSSIVALYVRLLLLKKEIGISLFQYVVTVILPGFFILIISFIVSFIIHNFFDKNIVSLICWSFLSCIITSTIIMLIGLNNMERKVVINIIHDKLLRIKRNHH